MARLKVGEDQVTQLTKAEFPKSRVDQCGVLSCRVGVNRNCHGQVKIRLLLSRNGRGVPNGLVFVTGRFA